jgi:hypothetical protein
VNNPARRPVVFLWTACVVRRVDPQAAPRGARAERAIGGTWGTRACAVRSLLHTGIPLCDWRAALFPIVPSPYSYNL